MENGAGILKLRWSKRLYQSGLIGILVCLLLLPLGAEEESHKEAKKYSSSTSFSCVLVKGNSQEFTFSFDTEQNLKFIRNSFNLKAGLIYSHSDKELRSEVLYSHLKYGRRLNSRAFLLLLLRTERNKLAGYNYRFSFTGGGGYSWLKTNRVEISSEASFGWSSENNTKVISLLSSEDELYPKEVKITSSFLASFISSKLTAEISSSARLVCQPSVFINMSRLRDYRLDSYLALSVSISRYFALKSSIKIIYYHQPVTGYKNMDSFFLSSIVLKI